MVRTWLVSTALVSLAGVIWMLAFTQTLDALPLPPAAVLTAVLVSRVIAWPSTVRSELALTTVVPVTADLIVTVQLALVAPPTGTTRLQVAGPTKAPGPLTMAAVAV